MGNGCCKVESEFNPDGSPKEPQTKEQAQAGADDLELRKAAKDGDKAELERLLRRMPRRQIQSGARKNEGEEADCGKLRCPDVRARLPATAPLIDTAHELGLMTVVNTKACCS